MNQIAPINFASDPYFHDIIREMEAIAPKVEANLGRRQFLKIAGGAGAGLVLAFSVGGPFAKGAKAATNAASEAVFNAYIRIAPSGAIILYNKAPEIGQGIKTSFPMILAEHLDADWADVKIEQAPINPAVYGRQSAGGSRSTPTGWEPHRRAGAVARAMLVSAAAKEWGVPESELKTEKSTVIHAASGRRIKYGAL
ncbi:MAG TPA: molybdopterin cofactor-binding domain-containing protein, partial [Micropepsaceae bacterium]|nr:molybdopterin cofactor-binding domain-containing protein [Micropepsaceae bacterium]